jgi:hypothetical protein
MTHVPGALWVYVPRVHVPRLDGIRRASVRRPQGEHHPAQAIQVASTLALVAGCAGTGSLHAELPTAQTNEGGRGSSAGGARVEARVDEVEPLQAPRTEEEEPAAYTDRTADRAPVRVVCRTETRPQGPKKPERLDKAEHKPSEGAWWHKRTKKQGVQPRREGRSEPVRWWEEPMAPPHLEDEAKSSGSGGVESCDDTQECGSSSGSGSASSSAGGVPAAAGAAARPTAGSAFAGPGAPSSTSVTPGF